MNSHTITKINPINKLLTLRLKWYGKVAKDAVVKYKILIIFFILMFSPNFNSVMRILSFPIGAFFTKSISIVSYFQSILCFQFIAFALINLQFGAFNDEPWRDYLTSLPLNRCQLIIVDVMLMLVANLMIWIMLFCSAYHTLNADNIDAIEVLILIRGFVSSVLLTFSLQIIFLKRAFSKIVQIIILNSLLLVINIIDNYFIENTLFLIYLTVSLYSIWSSYNYRSIRDASFIKSIFIVKGSRLNKILFPNFRIQVKLLVANSAMQLILLQAIVIIVQFIAFYFDAYRISNKIYLIILSFLNLLISLICSNYFSRLNNERQSYYNYLSTMPISKWKVFYSDYFIVFTLQFLFFSILHAGSYLIGLVNLYIIFTNLFISIIFLICTYYPQNYYKRYGMFISLIIMSVFFIVNYNYIMYLAG